MKVRMKVALSGTRDGAEWPPAGGEMDVPDTEGADLCSAGLAEPVADTGEPDKAVRQAAETSTPETAERPARQQADKRPARGRQRKQG